MVTGGPQISPETEQWDGSTMPFDAVRFFSRENVRDVEILQVLDDQSITSLSILEAKSDHVFKFMKEQQFGVLLAAITAAIERSATTPEKILGGALIYDDLSLADKNFSFYSESAVSAIPQAVDFGCSAFTLVLGPSGSGKTVFALKRLPRLVFGEALEHEILVVHFHADKVAKTMDDQSVPFSETVAFYVNELITNRLACKGFKDDVQSLNINLHVVIDETGGHSDCFDDAGKILEISNAIKMKMRIKILAGVHLTVTGSRLETTTARIESASENPKFRMQPWTADNFDFFVDASAHPDKSGAKAFVRRFSVLLALLTNARCAFFLLDALTTFWMLHDIEVENFVTVVVSKVVQRYTASNELGSLSGLDDKWAVARSVFRALDCATKQRGEVIYVHFEDLPSDRLRFIASTLLDYHIENSKGNLVLTPGSRFAVSMTPALAIVVANLLSSDANMYWDWRGFEFVVVLGELKWMVANLTEMPSDVNRTLLVLKSPIPFGNVDLNFTVPLISKYTVVLNGPVAPYADVIAPYRLVQVRFSRYPGQSQDLDLNEEMRKFGLTDDPTWRLQQAVTSVFHTLWQSVNNVPIPADVLIKTSDDGQRRIGYYPYNTFASARISGNPGQLVCYYNKDSEKVEVGVEKQAIAALKDFNEGPPVTAVFVTNCREFRLRSLPPTKAMKGERDATTAKARTNAKIDVFAEKYAPVAGGLASDVASPAKRKSLIPRFDTIVYSENVGVDSTSRQEKYVSQLQAPSGSDASEGSDLTEQQQGTTIEESITIGRDDVCWDGKLISKLDKRISVTGLRKNVEVRFLFC